MCVFLGPKGPLNTQKSDKDGILLFVLSKYGLFKQQYYFKRLFGKGETKIVKLLHGFKTQKTS